MLSYWYRRYSLRCGGKTNFPLAFPAFILYHVAGMMDFDIKSYSTDIESPEIHITGWNRLIQRTGAVEMRADLLKPLPPVRGVSGTVNRRVRVHTRSWFFSPLAADEDNTPEKKHEEPSDYTDSNYMDVGYRDSELSDAGLMTPVPDDGSLHKQDIETLTPIRIPSDAVRIQDRLNYILQPPIESILNLPTLEMPFEPFPFQRQGIAFLYSAEFAILADEMGLGKTMQAITTIRLLLRTGEIRNVLLICPKPLITNWRREFEVWAPEISIGVIDGSPARRKWMWQLSHMPVRLANYELLSRDQEFFDPPKKEKSPFFDLVVLDESQRIKNQGNATSQAAKAISRRRNWALTGTPVENSSEDIVGIFDFLSSGFLKSGLPPTAIKKVVGEHILRRTKEEVLKQLPPKMMKDAHLELSPEQAISYKMAEDEGVLRLSAAGDEVTIPQVFQLILRLKQICNFDPATGQSAKLERLLADIEEVAQSGQKAIIFSQWVETLYRLKTELSLFGTTEYHGDIPLKKRDGMIQQFREDKDTHVILMSYGAGSVGLNLQFAGYVFLFDRWWNPAVEDQAINRAHRIGASGPVTVTRFTTVNTVEERINRTLEEKRELSELILSGAQGLNSSKGLNQEELFGLFNLQVPAKLKKAS